jgi:hypothetical protein
MPTREQTIIDAIRTFEAAEFPTGLTKHTAWLGIYQTLLWCEKIDWLGFDFLPHIIDADKLRPSSPAKKRAWKQPSAWQRRADVVNQYLSSSLKCPPSRVQTKTDLLMKQPEYKGMQRQNSLGIAFSGLVKFILEKFGSRRITYETEVEATNIFTGITFPGRSVTPRIDLLARRDAIPRAILSAKWSMRHDRLSDITNECPVYKTAYERIYRQSTSGNRLMYYVLTNEYDASRLNKVLSDSCVDGVVHVNKKAVVEICKLNGRTNELIDLADFIDATKEW